MVKARIANLILVLIISVALAASAAQALTVNTATSSLDMGAGCGDSFCAFDIIYGLDSNPSLSGTFDLSGTTLTYSVNLGSVSMSALSGSDGGVTSVIFSDVIYSGTVTVVDEGSGMYSVTDQATNVSGTLTPVGAGAAVLFDLSGINTTGTCNDAPGASLTCGLTIGAGSGMPILVNGVQRYFRHTIDIRSVVPEPNTALLVAMGLVYLGRGKNRSR